MIREIPCLILSIIGGLWVNPHRLPFFIVGSESSGIRLNHSSPLNFFMAFGEDKQSLHSTPLGQTEHSKH